MLNNIRNYCEEKTRIWVFTFSVLLWLTWLWWCSEEEESKQVWSSNNPSLDNSSTTNTWLWSDNQDDTTIIEVSSPVIEDDIDKVYWFQLTWEIYWSSISLIDPITWVVILSWIESDNQWRFTILSSVLEAALQGNNLTLDSQIIVESEWWITKDWDWNGVFWDARSVLWKYKTVLTQWNLNELEDNSIEYIINEASTLVVEIMFWDNDWLWNAEILLNEEWELNLILYKLRFQKI